MYHDEIVSQVKDSQNSFIQCNCEGGIKFYLNTENLSLQQIYSSLQTLPNTIQVSIVDRVTMEGSTSPQLLVITSAKDEKTSCSLIDENQNIMKVSYTQSPIIEFLDLKDKKSVLEQ
jgi:hypothetical protein